MSAIEENEKLRNKIISLKVEKEEAKKMEDLLKNKLKEKEEICENREAEIVSLRKQLEQVKKSWESSQTLDNILNAQKPQYDKSGLVLMENHQVLRIMQELMPTYFPATQKKKNHFIKGPSQIQRMKKE